MDNNELKTFCTIQINQDDVASRCQNIFEFDSKMNFVNGLVEDNICYITSPNQFNCINNTSINDILMTNKQGQLLSFNKLTNLSINDNSFIAVYENRVIKSVDAGIQKSDPKVIHEFESMGISDVQISPKRFCIQSMDSSLQCSGHEFNPLGLQVGGAQSCFIKPNENKLHCWGAGVDALLKVPREFDQDTQGVALGSDHICGIDGTGRLKCWGNNDYNQCDIPPELGGKGAGGDANVQSSTSHTADANSNPPKLSVSVDSSVRQTDAGVGQTCAVSGSGKLHCWGSNQYGQSEVDSDLFAAHTQSISTGGEHTCGIDQAGKIVCWGNNLERQCNVPQGFFLSKAQKVSAGMDHTCAISLEGRLKCWGSNDMGEADVPKERYLHAAVDVSAGADYTCGIDMGKQLDCWGVDRLGQSTPPRDAKEHMLSVSAGTNHACAVQQLGKISCWGDNYKQQADVPKYLFQPLSLSVGGVESFRLSSSSYELCYKRKGNMVCKVGPDDYEFFSYHFTQIKDQCIMKENLCYKSTIDEAHSLVRCANIKTKEEKYTSSILGHRVKQLSCGYEHVCVLYENGMTECMGGSEQYKEAELTDHMKTGVKKMKAGKYITCVFKQDMKIQCKGKQVSQQVKEFKYELPFV